MRLHRLELTAFGPFAQTAVVDFDGLATDGLFLLHGDTGAGKTTVLDAIAFALYGTVPGPRRECKRLHSDHAAADIAPQVVLEATIAGRRLRLSRSPEHERPKRRGPGVRTEQPRATLTWLDGRGQHLTRLTDIGDEVNRLLGMSADQFFQVVLLPQGEFARFLCAANEDREALLERLFDTHRFGTAEQWLADRRRSSAGKLERHRHAIDRLAAQVCTASGAVDPTEGRLEWAQELLADARTAKAAATVELEERQTRADQAASDLAEGRRVADLQRRKAIAAKQFADYSADADARAELTRELADAARAEPLAAARAELSEAEATANRATSAFEALREHWPYEHADPDAIDSSMRESNEELGRMRDLAAAADMVATLDLSLRQMTDERDELASAAAMFARDVAHLPAVRRTCEEDLRVAERSAARLPTLVLARDAAADSYAAAVDLQARTRELVTARAVLAQRRDEHQDARDRVLDLRERRLAGMAAELATALADGEPCKVCGAVEHPAPAEFEGSAVTKADEAVAQADEKRSASLRDGADQQVKVLEADLLGLTHRGGAGDPAVLAANLEAAQKELDDASTSADRVATLVAQLGSVTEQQRVIDESSRTNAHARAVLDERIAATTARADELRARIRTAIGADRSVESRRARIEKLVGLGARLRDAGATVRAATTAVSARRTKLESLSLDAGFDTVADGLAVVRPRARKTQIELQLATARERWAHANAVLADPDISAIDGLDPVDLPALESARASTARELATAIARHTKAVDRAEQLEDLTAQLWAATDRLAPAEAAHMELDRIADIVAGRGQNSRRMSLRSYVLAARLEEVAVAASRQLRRMSGGRYEFVHSDASGPRGRRGGLGLEIRDDYTGSIRPAKTLSGGESFTASLALALGLADVVAAESGGLVLDTMFIDEGFGGLDNDTLDSVMGVLDELRAGGRVVGIVSHVEDIRQRIPNRLHVIRERTGSRLEVKLAG
ncbi:AAA family ATPase [Antrihabitans sp. YC2-6]|uniref:AAA family ATPase n=1 Tax=Antrihabitans sp. YC2-6 TaxID=2799498 RepID=UPI0018F77726|nr:SMC family ATPase [Antrihabitans sp. YC2-6]MBJ8343744.1 SMC family ATPase [Antrihabitans sp. YC2-6]